MPAPVSKVATARAALFAAIDAQAIITSPVLLCYDGPGPHQPEDIVCVEGVTRTVRPYGMVGDGGANAFYEEFRINVVIDCFRGGDLPVVVFEQACALNDAVVEAVRADLTLAGTVLKAEPEEQTYETGWDDEHKGRRARITCPIRCVAVL